MTAKQIWKNGENGENIWMCLVKNIVLDSVPKSAVTSIAVDSKYWLYINGSLAVFEGGLKRGPSMRGTYYDEVDIAKYLKVGENTIAVLVWYFGKDGFSHLSSGQGGLLFDADLNGEHIVSNGTWKLKKHPSYVAADTNDPPTNFRLAESNIYFDASLDLGKWYMPGYDVSTWDNADIITDSSWGTLKKRIIPQLKNFLLKDYENSADFEDFTTSEETVLEMKLAYNAQLTPYLKITAPRGKRITIKTENYNVSMEGEKCAMAVYYTTDGVQEHESLGWINGESIFYTIPAGVTVHSLKYRETGYDTKSDGHFECDDEFLNKLWQKSLRTLYITMRDNFMDCPDRERAQWWGDVNIEMQMSMYCLDEKALLLYKKGADSLAGWYEDCGSMMTVVPSGTRQFELPFQNLAGIWGFSYYYAYTGDRSLIERVYPMSKSYVMQYEMNTSGLVTHRSGSWDWPDWGDNSDLAPMENAWYYMALSSCKKMATLLGFDNDVPLFTARMKIIKENYSRAFYRSGYYYHSTQNQKPDDRANSLAVLSGLADKSQYESIAEVLRSSENSSPYMEKYVLDALCEMGYIDDAVNRMKKRYREMVECDYSTLWEYWNTNGTKNHAWSGGPLITMSKYIAGIKPLDTSYSRFEIKPHIGKLKHISCVVPSVKGKIALDVQKSDAGISMTLTIPKDTIAEVYLPLSDNSPPQGCVYEFTLRDGYAKFILTEGKYTL